MCRVYKSRRIWPTRHTTCLKPVLDLVNETAAAAAEAIGVILPSDEVISLLLASESELLTFALTSYYAGALSGDRRASSVCTSVCLSDVAYIGSNSKTKRPRKTKLCPGVPQVTCDSHTDFKVKRSKVKVTGRGNIVAAT